MDSPHGAEFFEPFLQRLLAALPLYVWVVLLGLCLVRVAIGPDRRRALILLVALFLASFVYFEGEYHVHRFHEEGALPAPICHFQEVLGSRVHLHGTFETQPLGTIDPSALADVDLAPPDPAREAGEEDRWIEARAAQIHSITYPIFAIVGMLTLVAVWLVQPSRRRG